MKLKDFLKERTTIVGLDIAEDLIQAANPQAIKQLWAKNKARSKRVNLVIHGRDLLLHVVTIPYLKDEAIQSALESRVNQYVSFAGVKTVIAWEKVSEISEAGERRLKVLLAVVRKELADAYISAVEKAGLFLNAITFPSLASIQALKETSLKSRPKEKKMFVEVDDHQTFVHVLEGGTITFAHTLNSGAKEFLSSGESINNLTDDLQKILHTEKEIQALVFHSSDDQLKGRLTGLGEKFGLPVQVEEGAITSGLAKMKTPKINLLPWEVKRAEEWRQQISYFLFSVLGLSLFMLFLFFLLYLGSFMINRQIDAVKSELDKPTEEFVQLREVEDKTNEIKNLLAGRKRLAEKSRDFPWDDLFNELNRVVPSNVYLTRVEVNQEEAVIISGVAESSDYIFDFVRKLKEAKHFKNVDLKVIKETEFSIYAERK